MAIVFTIFNSDIDKRRRAMGTEAFRMGIGGARRDGRERPAHD